MQMKCTADFLQPISSLISNSLGAQLLHFIPSSVLCSSYISNQSKNTVAQNWIESMLEIHYRLYNLALEQFALCFSHKYLNISCLILINIHFSKTLTGLQALLITFSL